MSSELQKVGNVSFRIVDKNLDMGFTWKDGVLYLTLQNVMLTDGDTWYEIPIKELRDIEAEKDESISFVVENMSLNIKGKSAERLLALRHLLLPLIDGSPTGSELTESVIKLLLLGIDDLDVQASLLKREPEEIRDVISKAEKEGLIKSGIVTEKGKAFLTPEERELLEKAESGDR